MKHLSHDDLQGRFFIELCGSTVLAEVSFDVDDVIPVLVVCNSEAHQAFLKEHMIQMILKRMADANHFMHNELIADQLHDLYLSLFQELPEEEPEEDDQ